MSQWSAAHPDEDYDEHFGLPRGREAHYGSYDIGLANPPESLPESAPCFCGHTLEDHEGGYNPGRCLWKPDPRSDQWDSNPCDCSAFELDE